MMMLETQTLANGLKLSFADESNRYFGDYHRILLVVKISCDLETLSDDQLRTQAIGVYGKTLDIERRFERMGVPTAEVESVQNEMIVNFMRQAATYMARPDYPARLVTTELKKHRPSRIYG